MHGSRQARQNEGKGGGFCKKKKRVRECLKVERRYRTGHRARRKQNRGEREGSLAEKGEIEKVSLAALGRWCDFEIEGERK